MSQITLRLHGALPEYRELPENLQKIIGFERVPAKELRDLLKVIYNFLREGEATDNEKLISIKEGSLLLAHGVPSKVRGEVFSLQREKALEESSSCLRYIQELEKISYNSGYSIDLSLPNKHVLEITPTQKTGIKAKAPEWVRTEICTTGKIINIGGLKPNVHISTEEYGVMIVPVTEEQAQELTVYKTYDVTVHARRKRGGDREFSDFRFISIKEKKKVPRISTEMFIAREEKNWIDIGDPTGWVRSIRGDFENEKEEIKN